MVVVFFFHARRPERSIPVIFGALGDLVELLPWGLPDDEALTDEPYLLAAADQYLVTVDRLQRSFVGPDVAEPPRPLDRVAFDAGYEIDTDEYVSAYRRVRAERLPFHYRRRVFLDRVRQELGYPAHNGRGTASP